MVCIEQMTHSFISLTLSNWWWFSKRTISGWNAFSPTFYFVPVQTIVSPYDAKCVTPLIYPTTDWDNCFVWLKFVFFYFLKPAHNFFCKRHYPIIVINITRHVLYTGKCTRLYILEIIKAWPVCILWTRGHRCLLTQLYKIKTFG